MLKEGIYEEIISTKLQTELLAAGSSGLIIGKEKLDAVESRKLLSQHISTITRRALSLIRDDNPDDKESLLKQIRTCNEIISLLSDKLDEDEFNALKLSEEAEVLTYVVSKLNNAKVLQDQKQSHIRPLTSLTQTSLFTGSHSEPDMLSEIKREIRSCDCVDLLISFIKWSGLVRIIDDLRDLTQSRNGMLRVITTSYMQATDFHAVMELGKLQNTEIKISYDVERTRLHAKAYMFKRQTGFTTAYIGSSNISNPALTAGLEWNLKVTEKDSFDVVKKFETTFESYWNDSEFVGFNSNHPQDVGRLNIALARDNHKDIQSLRFNLDIRPYHFQQEILEKLKVEREMFGRYKNLVVAATGTGKTIISAFDYKRFRQENGRPARLLFVAHREEILEQSRDSFRHVLRDGNFGALLVGANQRPDSIDHLFISIQSFNSKRLDEITTPDFYDFIIVDEFHHAAAPSYQRLLAYYQPKILLGLTATPERMDGQNVLEYFEDTIAAELRLTEAIDRKLLCPFQYFGVSDSVDLSTLSWSRKGYDLRELENVYTKDSKRVSQIINSIDKYVADRQQVKGLGFCVSIEHAKFMAEHFNKSGMPSIALYADVDAYTRKSVKDKLVRGDINYIFVVDLYNEGIDIPEVNTILFLRPTESLTVFLQQLGRGLRHSDEKECLTVLDFIGQAHKSYRFEDRYRALIGQTRHSVRHYLDNGFFNLPKGCFIQLEKQAKEYVLRNIKDAANTKGNLIAKMKYFSQDTGQPLTLHNFLQHYQLTVQDFYGRGKDRTFIRMQVEAGLREDFVCEYESDIQKKLQNLFHFNSKRLLDFVIACVQNSAMIDAELGEEEQLMLAMLYYSFYSEPPMKQGFASMREGMERVFASEQMKEEVAGIAQHNLASIDFINIANDFKFDCLLDVHCRYNTAQIMAAFGYFNQEKAPAFREGVKHLQEKKLDIFFITLNKSEKDFSPSTLYEDYAINEQLFHWQSQGRTAEKSETGQRYIQHRQRGGGIALFVREYKNDSGLTSPFMFLGSCDYISHTGSKPISFIWQLRHELPPMFVAKANKNIL